MLHYVEFVKHERALSGGYHRAQVNADIRDLQRPDDHLRRSLRMHLKGVMVKVQGSNLPPKSILDIVDQAGHQEFDKDGERCTVAVRD